MNEVRLAQAIKLLNSVPNDPRFDMGHWGSGERDGFGRLTLNLAESKLREGCRTSACALGWIASTQEANEAGLHLKLSYALQDSDPNHLYAGGNFYSAAYHKPNTSDMEYRDLDAAKHYFEFHYPQTAYLLFMQNCYQGMAFSLHGIKATDVAGRMTELPKFGELVFIRNQLRAGLGSTDLFNALSRLSPTGTLTQMLV